MNNEKAIKTNQYRITYVPLDARGHADGSPLVKVVEATTETKAFQKLKVELVMTGDINNHDAINIITSEILD